MVELQRTLLLCLTLLYRVLYQYKIRFRNTVSTCTLSSIPGPGFYPLIFSSTHQTPMLRTAETTNDQSNNEPNISYSGRVENKFKDAGNLELKSKSGISEWSCVGGGEGGGNAVRS